MGLKALTGRGRVLERHISYDPKYRIAQVQGKTGAEIDTRVNKKGQVTSKGPIAREVPWGSRC